MSDIVFGGRSDIWSTNLGCASVGTPDIRPPPQTISYTCTGEDGLEKLVEGVNQSKKLKSLDMVRSGLTSKRGQILCEVQVVSGFPCCDHKMSRYFSEDRFLRETFCVPPPCVTSSECRALFRVENLHLSKCQGILFNVGGQTYRQRLP